MVFQPARTFLQPALNQGRQQGFPSIGAGAQTTGDPTPWPADDVSRGPVRPTKGRRSWLFPSAPDGGQRGYPTPEIPLQSRPPSCQVPAPQYGGSVQVYTPYFDRGAAAFVQNFGKVLYNPIGAGIVARFRPLPSYGMAGQYLQGAVWWSSQAIPTSINSQSLIDPQVLAALLSQVQIQGVVRTTA
jgi:hypothetical protein